MRFPPGGEDEVAKIMKEAKYVHRHHQREVEEPWYRLSVWIGSPREGETEREVLQRLVVAAGLGGLRVDEERNRVLWRSTVGELLDQGFTFKKDGYPDEPDEHYSVDLGPAGPTREVVERFVKAFRGPVETRWVT
jgi:hypothetical protein